MNLFNEQFCELLHLTTADFEYRKLDDKNEYDYRYTYQNLITVSTRKETEKKKLILILMLKVRLQMARKQLDTGFYLARLFYNTTVCLHNTSYYTIRCCY